MSAWLRMRRNWPVDLRQWAVPGQTDPRAHTCRPARPRANVGLTLGARMRLRVCQSRPGPAIDANQARLPGCEVPG